MEEDYKIENLVAKYKLDMEVLKSEELKKANIKKREPADIDPKTGKPRVAKDGDEESEFYTHPDFDEFQKHFEEFEKNNPEFANKEFYDYLQKRRESSQKLKDLYMDDDPYDAKFEETMNEEEQLKHLSEQIEIRQKQYEKQ